MAHKTIFENDFTFEEVDNLFLYQSCLTKKLDELITPFDQQVINEIVLWKVNRFATLTEETLKLLNSIKPEATNLDIELTTKVLKALLKTKGIQLPMASTILRFRNKNIYQIIDQRVYRMIYKDKLKIKTYSNEVNLTNQVKLYLDYLLKLRTICNKHNIQFSLADRILFMADKRINKGVKIDGYSSRIED